MGPVRLGTGDRLRRKLQAVETLRRGFREVVRRRTLRGLLETSDGCISFLRRDLRLREVPVVSALPDRSNGLRAK